jgi:uncharacterized protein (TIGR02145 family)
MSTKNLKLSVIFATVAIILSSCSKDVDNKPVSSNPSNGKTTAVFNSSVTYGTMTDQDGNVYKTVTIGTQTWMAENLRTTKYNNGTAIPLVTDNKEWEDLTTGGYSNSQNTSNIENIATYGRLYNWYAINTGKLAPKGWHVPTDIELKTLTTFLGGGSYAGGKLKETGTLHWWSPNTGATNETGFTALPGGSRMINGIFTNIRTTCYLWSATECDTSNAWVSEMTFHDSDVGRDIMSKKGGFSVRCVKD